MLEPASLAATAKALAEAEADHRRHMARFELAVERARFEAERARRQFDAVEPENRLVGRTLERVSGGRRWSTQRQAEANLAAQRSVSRPGSVTRKRPGWPGPAPMSAPCFTRRPPRGASASSCCGQSSAEVVVTVRDPRRPGRRQHRLGRRCRHELHPRAQQDRQPLPHNRRGHRRPGAPSGRSAMTTRPSLPSCPSRAGGPGPALRSPKPRVAALRVSRGYRPSSRRPMSHHRDDDANVLSITGREQTLGFQPGDALSLDARRLPPRRAAHSRRPLAHPHHRRAPPANRARSSRRLGSISIRRPEPSGGPPDRVAQGPTRRARGSPCQPRKEKRPTYQRERGHGLDCSTHRHERSAQCQPQSAGPTRQRFSFAAIHSRLAR